MHVWFLNVLNACLISTRFIDIGLLSTRAIRPDDGGGKHLLKHVSSTRLHGTTSHKIVFILAAEKT
jgi:hypothetical protein